MLKNRKIDHLVGAKLPVLVSTLNVLHQELIMLKENEPVLSLADAFDNGNGFAVLQVVICNAYYCPIVLSELKTYDQNPDKMNLQLVIAPRILWSVKHVKMASGWFKNWPEQGLQTPTCFGDDLCRLKSTASQDTHGAAAHVMS